MKKDKSCTDLSIFNNKFAKKSLNLANIMPLISHPHSVTSHPAKRFSYLDRSMMQRGNEGTAKSVLNRRTK